jgi:putative peptidoglycan lipid II flippase
MTEELQREKQQITRASKIMGLFTLLSRFLGLVRNQILSHFFGATWVADAFVAAFTIPNALRRLFGEGALTPAIVSIFTRILQGSKDPQEHKGFVTAAFWWFTALICLVVLIGIAIAPWLVRLYVPEFTQVPGKIELTVALTRWMFPFILFIGWAALGMGFLNSIGSFSVSAFSPALLNLSVIVLVPIGFLIWQPEPQQGIFIFASAVVLGGLLQALIHLRPLEVKGLAPAFRPSMTSPHLKDLKKLLLPSMIAMGTYQLNIIVNRIFASQIDGAVSHLFYADLILELPISLIAVSLGTAVLPTFSRYAAAGNRAGLRETFRFSMESVLFFAIPSMFGLIALATPLCSSLYFSGKFTEIDLTISSRCLIGYSLGLPFFASLRIITPLFFARKDTMTPTVVSFISLVVNFVAAWQLSSRGGAAGIALATVLSSLVNSAILTALVFRQNRDFEWLKILVATLKMLLAGFAMGSLLWFALQMFPDNLWTTSGITATKLGAVFALVALGILTYGFAAWVFRVEQIHNLIIRLRSKMSSR